MKSKQSDVAASHWKHLLTFLMLLHHKARRLRPGRNEPAPPRGCALAARYRSQ
jgi:hypothetical protein